jgi:hypothetical protein
VGSHGDRKFIPNRNERPVHVLAVALASVPPGTLKQTVARLSAGEVGVRTVEDRPHHTACVMYPVADLELAHPVPISLGLSRLH